MKYKFFLDEFNRITSVHDEQQTLLIPEWVQDPFVILELTELPSDLKIGEHGIINGQIVYIGIVASEEFENQKYAAVSEINSLKTLLVETDYKVIKNYELSLAGLPLRYDAVALHNERQAYRDRINELETQFNL